MKTKAVHIRASVGFLGLTPSELVLQAKTVHDSMPNNPLYTGAPVDAATLQAAIDAYIASAALATDSKKAAAEREKQRMTIIHLLRLLAHFVEAAAKEDMAAFMTSGFKPATYNRTAPQPLSPTSVTNIEQGTTGQFLVKVKPVPKARHYQVRYAPAGPGGALPTSWTMEDLPNAKKPLAVNNLAPGTMYVFQARAYGLLGYTDWSDPSSRMAI